MCSACSGDVENPVETGPPDDAVSVASSLSRVWPETCQWHDKVRLDLKRMAFQCLQCGQYVEDQELMEALAGFDLSKLADVDLSISCECPPIPDRSFDYAVVNDSTYDGSSKQTVGQGATRVEAIADFVEQLQ